MKQITLIREISGHIEGINSKVETMTEKKETNTLTDARNG
jgi:glutamine synthetase